MAQSEKQQMQKHIILQYFNRYLRDRGTITEKEYLRLSHLIACKYPVPERKK